MDPEVWQQQIDEVLALSSIFAEDLTLHSVPGVPQGQKVDLELLPSLPPPMDPESDRICLVLLVHVPLPEEGLDVMVPKNPGGLASSAGGGSCSNLDPQIEVGASPTTAFANPSGSGPSRTGSGSMGPQAGSSPGAAHATPSESGPSRTGSGSMSPQAGPSLGAAHATPSESGPSRTGSGSMGPQAGSSPGATPSGSGPSRTGSGSMGPHAGSSPGAAHATLSGSAPSHIGSEGTASQENTPPGAAHATPSGSRASDLASGWDTAHAPQASASALLAAHAGTSAGSQNTPEPSSPGSAASEGSSADEPWMSIGERVRHLPPMRLTASFPSTYPVSAGPLLSITAPWLDDTAIASLQSNLDQAWLENGGASPFVYEAYEWLRTTSLETLGISSELRILDCDGQGRGQNAFQVAHNLLTYSRHREAEEFAANMARCEICYEEMTGARFVMLPECQHYFCRTCMTTLCTTLVKEGNLDGLRCPGIKCRANLSPSVLRELLTEEEFQRWDELLFQRTLGVMSDVAYCPRCRFACFKDSEECGQCAHCLYVFCANCLDSWHPGRKCLLDGSKLAEMEKQQEKVPENKRKNFEEKLQQLRSMAFLQITSKRCPSCGVATTKTEGCNKMTCSYCHSYWCYVCEKKIQSYAHFRESNGCVLFPNENIAPRAVLVEQHVQNNINQIINQMDLGGQGFRRCRCPRCHQTCFKYAANNHIRCDMCACNFCFLCREQLPQRAISAHFTVKSKCKQHTWD